MNQEAEGCGPGCRLGYHVAEQPRSQEARTIRSFDGRPSTPTPLPAETPFAVEGNRPCEHPFTRLYRRDGRIICDACGHDEPRLAEQPRSQEATLTPTEANDLAWRLRRAAEAHDYAEADRIHSRLVVAAAAQPRSQEATLTLVARIVQDCIYGLRNQPDISREGIAEVLERDVLAALAPTPSGD